MLISTSTVHSSTSTTKVTALLLKSYTYEYFVLASCIICRAERERSRYEYCTRTPARARDNTVLRRVQHGGFRVSVVVAVVASSLPLHQRGRMRLLQLQEGDTALLLYSYSPRTRTSTAQHGGTVSSTSTVQVRVLYFTCSCNVRL